MHSRSEENNQETARNLRDLEAGDLLVFDTLQKYLEEGKITPSELLPYLIKCFECVSKSRMYDIVDIVEAGESLEAIRNKKNPYFRHRTIPLFE